jgi:hypothetical protein
LAAGVLDRSGAVILIPSPSEQHWFIDSTSADVIIFFTGISQDPATTVVVEHELRTPRKSPTSSYFVFPLLVKNASLSKEVGHLPPDDL